MLGGRGHWQRAPHRGGVGCNEWLEDDSYMTAVQLLSSQNPPPTDDDDANAKQEMHNP